MEAYNIEELFWERVQISYTPYAIRFDKVSFDNAEMKNLLISQPTIIAHWDFYCP